MTRRLLCAVLASAAVVAVGTASAQVTFSNNEPDGAQQWDMIQDNAWTHWPAPPTLATVKVAVIDTGIDATHPEFVGRIAAGHSFVPGSWRTDTCGHGTFVAGEIAANPFNGVGIAGIAFNAKLLIAKVVQPNCDISTAAEVAAIRWAVAQGARVINLSIGGTRDPQEPKLDEYSAAEESAIEDAVSRGVLVVAASGNSVAKSWPYADYPAALPHVLGVAAVHEGGAVANYSNRDKTFVDLAAPGGAFISTLARNLIDPALAGCEHMGYSNCGSAEYQNAYGTSFAAPQVVAAAALLFGVDPGLTADQAEWILERSATDADAASGCTACPTGRDSFTGWGDLDIASALDLLEDKTSLPPADAYEPNDNADTPGASAHPFGAPRTISATLDYWDDPTDVYSIVLKKGAKLFARLGGVAGSKSTLLLWKPGATDVNVATRSLLGAGSTRSPTVAGQQRLAYRAPVAGKYYLEVKIGAPTQAPAQYKLAVAVGS
jgi:subtilisin family serine protease